MGKGVQLASGQVIALGRLLLGTLFLIVVWIDPSQPIRYPDVTYALLIVYVALAGALIVATWNNWWLDAHLAGPTHALDIALFTVLVYLTDGDRSPFFTFCVFVLLSAAIRWGWRSTALTAVLLALLYVVAGMLALGPGSEFEVGRFVARTGHLVILSLILIWFGVNQWRSRLKAPVDDLLAETSPERPTLESALATAMESAHADAGALVWARSGKDRAIAIVNRNGAHVVDRPPASELAPPAAAPFLYDVRRGRALTRDVERNLRASPAADFMRDSDVRLLGLSQGLAVPIISEAGEGQLYLEQVSGLSSDHLELGEQIGSVIAAHMQRGALMKAAEEGAEARSRLAIARDLHDSVVQFLAGAAFRIEATKRSRTAGRDIAADLDELKQLMLQEQGELRAFITALRSGSQIDMAELAKDMQSLANRLSRQWAVQCTFTASANDMVVPSRVHLDAQQLVREAVANAVRHAGAKNVSIRLEGAGDELRLDFINDGAAYPKTAGGRRMPASLKERVEAAGGALEISRGMGVTKLSISLPAGGRAA